MVRVYSDTNSKDTTFKIWNFGTPGDSGSGMSVSAAAPAIEISDNGSDTTDSDGTISLKYMALAAGKKYVLVNGIALGGTWSPIGTGSGTNAFKGKFYGNGHTISGLQPASAAYNTGLFGYVDGGERVRIFQQSPIHRGLCRIYEQYRP
jgi:hypothetical protein